MSRQQLVALAAPVVLIAMMVPIFQLLARAYGRKIGWHAGLTVYWLVWGAAYPLLLLGGEEILRLVKPVPFDPGALLLALIPVAFSVVGRFQFGVRYEKTTLWSGVALLATAFGNGLFEEILWRGTYLRLFPSDITLGILWPSVMFAMWHYAPGSVSSEGNVVRLMVGALFLGLLLGYLASRTDTIFWTILSHTLSGIILVI